jgi:hypothetical protein
MSGESESALALVTSDLPCYVTRRLCAWLRFVMRLDSLTTLIGVARLSGLLTSIEGMFAGLVGGSLSIDFWEKLEVAARRLGAVPRG